MPTSFQFLVFSDLPGMHDAKVKSKIRKHAMKDIGVTRRRPRKLPNNIVLRIEDPVPKGQKGATRQTQDQHHYPILDDRALYDPHLRGLSSKLDPFETASVPLDGVSHGLLQYFHHYSTKFPNNFTFTPNIDRVFDSAMQDDLMMNCILSAAASRIHYMQSVSPVHLQERALACTHQSLHLLQLRLYREQPVRAQTIETLVDCVLYLAAAAFYRGDDLTARIHLSAAVNMADLGGGLQVFVDQRVLVRLLSLDDVLACMRLHPCSFKSTYDPGALDLVIKRKLQAKQEGPDTSMTGDQLECGIALPKVLNGLIPQIVECDLVKDTTELQLMDSVSADSALQVRHWQKLSTLAARNKLLAFETADVGMGAIRAALLIWTLLPPNDPRQAKTAHIVARHLKALLEPDFHTTWTGTEEAGLWCLLVGAFDEIIGGEGSLWFITRIREVLRLSGEKVGLRSDGGLLARLVGCQRRFLYRETILMPLTERVVKLLEDVPHAVDTAEC